MRPHFKRSGASRVTQVNTPASGLVLQKRKSRLVGVMHPCHSQGIATSYNIVNLRNTPRDSRNIKILTPPAPTASSLHTQFLTSCIQSLEMTSTIFEKRGRAASRDMTSSPPSLRSSNSSHNSEATRRRVKHVIDCCRRRIERFTNASRSEVYGDGESVDSSSCFELRRPKLYSLPSQTYPRRAPTSRPRPLCTINSKQASYLFYMDADNRPFITTPPYLDEQETHHGHISALVTPVSE
ncbi:hypothetical protein C7974DRAFT_395969 [Boeremia exigua]|uniref:uncharacterized protein n=1 Tax=Boeremia exigua TaxID=749465 RepID=UPI001E8D32C9|nr:uncharacterized protein C7974DRAFT_395969 [Boeremia exigua]KAH6625369.1 hypothetical protein C7974DRAFT_395969 [Boeremia exigua]